MRVIGLDVSRTVAEVAYLVDGRIRAGGRLWVPHTFFHFRVARWIPQFANG